MPKQAVQIEIDVEEGWEIGKIYPAGAMLPVDAENYRWVTVSGRHGRKDHVSHIQLCRKQRVPQVGELWSDRDGYLWLVTGNYGAGVGYAAVGLNDGRSWSGIKPSLTDSSLLPGKAFFVAENVSSWRAKMAGNSE